MELESPDAPFSSSEWSDTSSTEEVDDADGESQVPVAPDTPVGVVVSGYFYPHLRGFEAVERGRFVPVRVNRRGGIRVLGEGTSSIVWAAQDLAHGRALVALKCARRPDLREAFVIEHATNRALFPEGAPSCRTLLPCDVGLFQHQNYPIIAMRLVGGGNLWEYATRHHLRGDARWLLETLAYLAWTLAYLHEVHGVAQSDVKPDNIVVERRTGVPVLIDYGLACKFGRPPTSAQAAAQAAAADGLWPCTPVPHSTPLFAPPQVPGAHPYASGALDVWELGVTVLSLINPAWPMAAKTRYIVDDVRAHAPDLGLANLLLWMVTIDPRQRATARQVFDGACARLGLDPAAARQALGGGRLLTDVADDDEEDVDDDGDGEDVDGDKVEAAPAFTTLYHHHPPPPPAFTTVFHHPPPPPAVAVVPRAPPSPPRVVVRYWWSHRGPEDVGVRALGVQPPVAVDVRRPLNLRDLPYALTVHTVDRRATRQPPSPVTTLIPWAAVPRRAYAADFPTADGTWRVALRVDHGVEPGIYWALTDA